jgi:hypothetical protein
MWDVVRTYEFPEARAWEGLSGTVVGMGIWMGISGGHSVASTQLHRIQASENTVDES